MACKCTVSGEKCTSEDIPCPDGKDCKTPDLSKAYCEIGGGDCAGYCECAYSADPAGCYLTKVPPADKACKCTLGADKKSCTAEHVDCKETGKCSTPDLSDAFCALAEGGDCKGYCTCGLTKDGESAKVGCYLKGKAPTGKACKCTKVDTTSCTATVVACKTDGACASPDTSSASCALADGGNCDGYCACGYSAKDSVDAAVTYGGAAAEGCFLTREAPVGKACKCSKGDKKCTAEVVECKTADKDKDLCKTKPDTSDLSCAIADGGDCNGYCACGYSADPAGCYLTAPAKDEKACKCTLASDKCVGAEATCKSADIIECKKPDTSDSACKNIDGGDCSGYCECEFVTDKGCKIKTGKKAPAKKACKCIKGGSTCTAAVVECLDSANAKCTTPDDTADACAQGQGDCSGY